MKKTDLIYLIFILFISSCNSPKTKFKEAHDLLVKSSVESLANKIDSLDGLKGTQKTFFFIDTTSFKYKRKKQLDSITTKRILNGAIVREGEFPESIDTSFSKYYFYDSLTSSYCDSSYIIMRKRNNPYFDFGSNLSLYLVRFNNEKIVLKLLANEGYSDCQSTLTISALQGNSVIYTYSYNYQGSDVINKDGKSFSVKTTKIKKYDLKDGSYTLFEKQKENNK
ncbi:MAG: hypothetical protein Q8928_05610 [Bacteroidota bacterium]|nr:hypothetical protein [Bacteroidota bacterium]